MNFFFSYRLIIYARILKKKNDENMKINSVKPEQIIKTKNEKQ